MIKLKSKEEKIIKKAAIYIAKMYKAKCEYVITNGNSYIYINNDKFDLLMTVCKTNKKKCIKIEEILVERKYRGKGICTELLTTLQAIAKKEGITLGLWCEENNKKLFNFYSRLGFKYIETLNDDWLEFN